jgi:DNA-binding MarR family transcriptional regulator
MDPRLQGLITASRRFSKSQIPRGVVLDGLDLRPPELHILFLIAKEGKGEKAGGPVQPSALAAIMGVTAGNITQIINAIEERGLIERTIDPSDRRKVMITLTPVGKEAVKRAGAAYREAYAGLLSDLGEKKTVEFTKLLDRAAAYFNDRFGPLGQCAHSHKGKE